MPHKLIDKQTIYTGRKIRLEVHHLEDDNGKRTQREVCVHEGAAVILPFLDPETILLIRNKRYAIGELLVELPAGTLEKGEAPMNCAGRELQEETGYLAGRLQPIGKFYSSPGILTEKMYAFAAYDLQKTVSAADEGEEIELLQATFGDALEMVRSGEIIDGKTIATLLLYERYMKPQGPTAPKQGQV